MQIIVSTLVTCPKCYTHHLACPLNSYVKMKWHILISLIIAVILCYLVEDVGFIGGFIGPKMTLLFPYSFLLAILLFGIYFWLPLFFLIVRLHERLTGTRDKS